MRRWNHTVGWEFEVRSLRALTFIRNQDDKSFASADENKRASQDRSRSAISDVRLSLDRCVGGDRGNGRLGQVQALAQAEKKRTVLR